MKEKIFRATANIISKDGINAVSTRAICRALGITAPTIYHYFKDKSELLKEVMEWSFEEHLKFILNDKPQADSCSLLKEVWDKYMDFAMNEKDLHSTMLTSINHGKIFDPGYRCFKRLIKIFEQAYNTGSFDYSSVEAAQIYISGAHGVSTTLFTVFKGDRSGFLKLSHKTRDLLLKNLLNGTVI